MLPLNRWLRQPCYVVIISARWNMALVSSSGSYVSKGGLICSVDVIAVGNCALCMQLETTVFWSHVQAWRRKLSVRQKTNEGNKDGRCSTLYYTTQRYRSELKRWRFMRVRLCNTVTCRWQNSVNCGEFFPHCVLFSTDENIFDPYCVCTVNREEKAHISCLNKHLSLPLFTVL